LKCSDIRNESTCCWTMLGKALPGSAAGKAASLPLAASPGTSSKMRAAGVGAAASASSVTAPSSLARFAGPASSLPLAWLASSATAERSRSLHSRPDQRGELRNVRNRSAYRWVVPAPTRRAASSSRSRPAHRSAGMRLGRPRGPPPPARRGLPALRPPRLRPGHSASRPQPHPPGRAGARACGRRCSPALAASDRPPATDAARALPARPRFASQAAGPGLT